MRSFQTNSCSRTKSKSPESSIKDATLKFTPAATFEPHLDSQSKIYVLMSSKAVIAAKHIFSL